MSAGPFRRTRVVALVTLAVLATGVLAAHPAGAQRSPLDGRWTFALELGEIPMKGSFKAGLSVGYHVNDLVWIGAAWQIPDSIRRGTTSFNAGGIPLVGMEASSESVGQRAYLQSRIRPHRNAPQVSLALARLSSTIQTGVFRRNSSIIPRRRK